MDLYVRRLDVKQSILYRYIFHNSAKYTSFKASKIKWFEAYIDQNTIFIIFLIYIIFYIK